MTNEISFDMRVGDITCIPKTYEIVVDIIITPVITIIEFPIVFEAIINL